LNRRPAMERLGDYRHLPSRVLRYDLAESFEVVTVDRVEPAANYVRTLITRT